MFKERIIARFDQRQWRRLLLLVFASLAVPTIFLVWQTYSQLKWESFHQYRVLAEELSSRIDENLDSQIDIADARRFADYTFLVVAGDPAANLVQRSPLSNLPVTEDVPGVIGYFQVDSAGNFSTPLLPAEAGEPENFGIPIEEFAQRQSLASEIRQVLFDNALLQTRLPATPEENKQIAVDGGVSNSPAAATPMSSESIGRMESEMLQGGNRQAAFDELYDADVKTRPMLQESEEDAAYFGLDNELTRKSEAFEAAKEVPLQQDPAADEARRRVKRREQTSLPEAFAAPSRDLGSAGVASDALRITTFESEIDPLEFSALQSQHLVLFRKVWRDSERIIQGLLIDQRDFVEQSIDAVYRGSLVSEAADLFITHLGQPIHTVLADGNRRYDLARSTAALDGSLLYRHRLQTPLDSLELVFRVKNLPAGPGQRVVGWATVLLAVLFVAGFLALYWLGAGRLRLARQQQDFVSAVSHELKTPLTSIRMYSEMLREGWTNEQKRQDYYRYIHDESERLSRLISNVLQLANIARSEPDFELKQRTVAHLLDHVSSKIENAVTRAGFTLEIMCSEDVRSLTVRVDDDSFSQIVINLVDNALKFSEHSGTKTIELACKALTDKQIQFTVRDYGPGIPKDQFRKIFTLFYRSESELTRETVGTGIGLAIVRQLTLAMNGSVDVRNVEPGSEFSVTLPQVCD